MKNKHFIMSIVPVFYFVCVANATGVHPKDSSYQKKITNAHYQSKGLSTFSSLSPAEQDPTPTKRFFFTIALTPDFSTTIPPVSLYFEKGIAKVASLGIDLAANYNRIKEADFHTATVGIGLRACGYAIPVLSKVSGSNVNSHGFDPYIGLTYTYFITAISEGDDNTFTSSKFGAVAGTRWYPGNKRGFGLMAEYSSAGILGGNVRVGITLGR